MSERGRETSMGESAGVQSRLRRRRRRRMRKKEEGKAWDKGEKKVVGFEDQGKEEDKENSEVGIPIASGSPPTDQESLLGRRRMRKKEEGKTAGKGEKKVVGFEEEEEEKKENRQGWISAAGSASGSGCGSGSGSPPTDQESEIGKKLVEVSSASSAAAKRIRRKKRRSNQKKNCREDEKDKVSRQSNQFHLETNITLSLEGVGREEPVKISECSSSIVDNLVGEELKKRKGSLGGFHKSSKEDIGGLPDIVFILRSVDTDLSNVYALDTGDLTLKLLVENFSCSYAMGFVASKSTLYAVEGEFNRTDFWTCDLTDWRNRDSFWWEKESSRPTFLGGVLPPVLLALDGNIYALASDEMYGTTRAASRFDDSVEKFRFEVFEPGRGWQVLPPPPFGAFCNDSGPGGRREVLWVHWGTVIEKTIYVGVGPMEGSHHRELYSYDVVSRVWAHIIPGHKESDCCDLIVSNLLKCSWPFLRFEVANNLYFECTLGYSKTDVQVYVWDLAAMDERNKAPAEEVVVKREKQLRDESSSASKDEDGDRDGDGDGYDSSASTLRDGDGDGYDSSASTLTDAFSVDSDVLYSDEYASPDDDNHVDTGSSSGIDDLPSSYYTPACPSFGYPVYGLESVTGLVKGGVGTKAFVAHLADNVYCLAYFYPSASRKGVRIRMCTFQAVKQQNQLGCLVRAKILRRTSHTVSPGLAFKGSWCTFCK